MKRTLLSDIARCLGVSTTLVSLVLNGKSKENRISDEIAAKVLETAKAMNYKPNLVARSLRTGQTQTIGLIVADIANPFFARIARAVEDEATKNGYSVIFCSSDENTDKSDKIIHTLVERQIDGLIIVPVENTELQITNLKESNIPFVLVDRYFPKIKTNYVASDDYAAAHDIVMHLIKNGKKVIGNISFDFDLVHLKKRTDGYKAALAASGLVYAMKLDEKVAFHTMETDLPLVMDRMLQAHPDMDALLLHNNQLCYHAINYLQKAEKRIPEDIALACFAPPGDFDFNHWPIDTVEQPIQLICQNAVQILLDEIHQKGNPDFKQVSLPSKLILRFGQ
jgi:LacI family transcriptional regulator